MITGGRYTTLGRRGCAVRPYYRGQSYPSPLAFILPSPNVIDTRGAPMDPYQQYQSCQVGDVGVALVVQVVDHDGIPVDLRTATNLKITLEKPDGSKSDKTATLYTDGSDGKMLYATVTNDLDKFGTWSLQGKYTLDGAKSTAVSLFTVKENA